MQKEIYGLTKSEYRELIEDVNTKAIDIVDKLDNPERVYRYRRLGFENEKHEWVENKHWEEDVNAICMFSVPDSFNKNDPNDCKVNFDHKIIFSYMFREYNRKFRRSHWSEGRKNLDEYSTTLQRTMRVGCFTAVAPECENMWDDPNFGDKGRGICIEYEVDDANFRPDNLAFLPVLYDDVAYDNTEAMKGVVDFAKDKNDESAIRKMVGLGYGHTIIKASKFEKEKEWRLVIPIRDDGAHLGYFDKDKKSKRDFTSAVRAIYIGPRFDTLVKSDKYMDVILEKWKKNGVPVYKIHLEDGKASKQLC